MDYTILVNKENKLSDDFKPYLVKVNSTYKESMMLELETYKAFLAMQAYLKEKGIIIDIYSAYRTKEYQARLFEFSTAEHGLEHTLLYTAKPGYSEHETGLALDFVLLIEGAFILEHDLLQYKEYEKVVECLSRFGFIIRYPKDKEALTGYNYEPWHLRYVGLEMAKYLSKNNLVLEEIK